MSDPTSIPASAVAPLIVTALLDVQSFSTLDELRRRHFPAALNRVPAHVTLFHHLPGDDLRAISERLASTCGRTAPIAFAMAETRFLGRGVALAVDCPGLVSLRADLARAWGDRLVAQDRQCYRPHATIQNKVTAAEARETQARLAALLPIRGAVEGLDVWHYRGGPWEEAGRFIFRGGDHLP